MTNLTSAVVRKKLIGPLVSLTTLFLCVAALELIGYVWETKTAQGPLGWTLVGARRIRLERHGSSDAPYYKFGANDKYRWRGIPVQINSQGFRGPEFSVEKPAGVYRILNLGDSVAFGWEIPYEDTYGRKLEAILNGRNDGRRYEVINVGIPSLNLEAERNLLLQEALKYQPDLVILDVTLVNDVYGSGPDISENPSVFQWLRDHTYSWPFLTTNVRFMLAKRMGPEAIPVLNPPTEEDQYYPLDENDKVYDGIFNVIKEMADATQNADADLIMVIFPTAYQTNRLHSNVPQLALTHRAQATGIKYVDMLPTYMAACDEAGPDQCKGYENLLFADVWMHPNRLGHSLAADALVTAINK